MRNVRKFVFIEANDKNTNQLGFPWAELEVGSNENTTSIYFSIHFDYYFWVVCGRWIWSEWPTQRAHVQIIINIYYFRSDLFRVIYFDIFCSVSLTQLSLSLTWSFVLLDFNKFVHSGYCLFCHFMLQLQSDESFKNCLAPRIALAADHSSQFPFSFFFLSSFQFSVAHQNRSVFIKYLITAKEGEMTALVLARYGHCTTCNVLLFAARVNIFLNRA